MEDSIENYIQMCKNTKSTSENQDNKISKEAISTIQRKHECEAYAVKIVMFLLDGKLQSEIFLKCLKYINVDYYQDVVDERALSKLCGYPLCGNGLPEMPKKKYLISTKANKVYDISERKNYCSNFCYKGSEHIKSQLDSSPLWLRNYKEMPEYNLIPTDVVCTPGEEIDYGFVRTDRELPLFTSVTHFTQMSLQEVGEIEKPSSKNTRLNTKYMRVHKHQPLDAINEDNSEGSESESERKNNRNEECNLKTNATRYGSSSVSFRRIGVSEKPNITTKDEKTKLQYLISKLKVSNEHKTKLIDPPPRKIRTRLSQTSNTQKLAAIQEADSVNQESDSIASSSGVLNKRYINSEISKQVKICVMEWITLDTFIHIYGENRVKQDLNENRMEEYFDKLKIKDLDVSYQIKYINMCRRLHMQMLAEEKFDNAILGYSLKPLPDFKKLKEQVQELDSKVKSFYEGILYEKPDSNFPSKPIKENVENGEEAVVLPLVDSSAQNALRRKVFLNSINKTLMKFIGDLKLDEHSVLLSVHELVKSFRLQPHNVIFKPVAWPVVTYILIKMLAIKYTSIQNQLDEPSCNEYCTLMMSEYIGLKEVLEEIFIVLKNVDKFVENYIMQN